MAGPQVSLPLFSVVIPTYNRADFIERTVRSVLDQSFPDFEIIVIDDGSTDDTRKIVSKIGDRRLSYHYKQNEERAAARNTGVRLSNGRYVTFLDSDDLFYPEHLAVAKQVIEKHGDPEFFHLRYEIRDETKRRTVRTSDLPTVANAELMKGNSLSCHGVFLRRDVALQYPFNSDRDLSGTEDYELWLLLASRFPLYCDRRITSALVQHDERSVVNTDRQRLVRRIELLEKYLTEDEQFVRAYGDRLSEFKANNRVYIALHLALSKTDRLGAVEYLARALRHSGKALTNRAFYGTLKRLFF